LAYEWAKDSGMIFNAQKCGTMSRHPLNLKIGNENIPQVTSYKYLGVPMKYNGVDWTNFFYNMTTKTATFQNAIEMRSSSWSSYTKLIIYRTFIRPTNEYALPLISQWAKRQEPNILKSIMNELDNLHKNALNWIFGRKGFNALFENMSGLEDPQFRVARLEASLCMHLQRLAKSNPLQRLLSNFIISSSKNDFLSFCRQSKLVSEFYQQTEVKWKAFILSKRKKYLLQKDGILHKYLANTCKSPSGTDYCLQQANSDSYIKWRSNGCFLRRKCPQCSQKFSRSHIHSCLPLPASSLQIVTSKKFETSSKMIKELTGQKNTFNIMDYLLNQKLYTKFDELMKWLDNHLPTTRIEPPT
jgi:hypothetical protein